MTASASLAGEPPVDDANRNGTYHFLDVGGLKYGECTLVEFGDTRILIDGSHDKDFEGQNGYPSIPEQIQSILGGKPPYDIDLIVVTHCHADHVGCLPDLVSAGIVRPKFALLTDPKLGFGRTEADDASTQDATNPTVRLAALLREEDASDLDDRQLRQFIDAVVTVESRYAAFLRKLEADGVEVIAYRGQALPQALKERLKATNVQLLGPTSDQLLFCAEQISMTNKEAEDFAGKADLHDDGDIVSLYRSIVQNEDAFRNPRGNGMNCQSITFAFGPPEARVLLAGDMQFSEPGVAGMDAEMRKLRQRVAAAGPYKLFKTTHHTSHNGQDDDFLAELGDPELIVHSGGLHDSTHPFPAVLKMLKGRGGIRFARTDRNGIITVKPHLSANRAIQVSRGRLNDFTPNRTRDEVGEPVVVQPSAPPGPASSVQVVIVNLPNQPIDLTVSGVDIRIRGSGERRTVLSAGGDRSTGGMLGVGIERKPPPDMSIGRSFERLLFVTDRERLRGNIGKEQADAALAAVEKAGGILQFSDGDAALDKTRQTLQALDGSSDVKGVVLLGGYDVVPSARTDAIGAELRSLLGARVRGDADQFWVWSDKLYGDKDGDAVAEYAVSRVPDAHDPDLFRAALAARPLRLGERFGVRNIVRAFAEGVWSPGVGQKPLNVCRDFLSTDVVPADLRSTCHYFMLHGAEQDGAAFSGEDDNGGYPVAFTAANVPATFDGLVFSGCCWGALIVDGKASQAGAAVPPHRSPQGSIALSYLKAGAVAFIGCTGSHYSGPDTDVHANYAGLLHREFWFNIAQPAAAPAASLHRAKQTYLRWVVEQGSRLDPLDTARRLKNFSQFTCLGLGW